MDISILTTFLTPFLPYLLKAGEKAAEETGSKIGGDAWEKAKGLWGKLSPKIAAKAAATEAVQDVVKDPQDKDAQAALRLQLKKLLQEDPTLASELARLFEEARQHSSVTNIIASGDRSVAIGGSASGNSIITGDQIPLK